MSRLEPAPLTTDDWQSMLDQYSAQLPPDEQIDGVSAEEAAIVTMEERLGTALPPSYRNFLLTYDGIDAPCDLYRMYPTAEVGWARQSISDLIEAWAGFDDVVDLLNRTLLVGDDESNAFYLLDPTVPTGDGEWTAIEWWTTPSEVTEYSSFGALAAALIKSD